MTNCKNCGAVLTGGKCEYCGTEYEMTTETIYAANGEKIEISTPNLSFGLTMDEAVERFTKLSKIIRKRGVPNDV